VNKAKILARIVIDIPIKSLYL